MTPCRSVAVQLRSSFCFQSDLRIVSMIIGSVKENALGERRVAATPDSVRKLKKLGL